MLFDKKEMVDLLHVTVGPKQQCLCNARVKKRTLISTLCVLLSLQAAAATDMIWGSMSSPQPDTGHELQTQGAMGPAVYPFTSSSACERSLC